VKLLIISNMAHYYRDGQLVGHGPTAREISYLSQLFEGVTHVGCLHKESAPDIALPYTTNNVQFTGLPPTGGITLLDKLGIILRIPQYLAAIVPEVRRADVVHVRCPANIPLIAIILLAFVKHPQKRWIKYAGNWKPSGKDALSYRFQRWWLRRNFARSLVTVNGEWSDAPEHVHAFLNPCLTEEELVEGQNAAQQKHLESPLNFLFVGRVERAKGVEYALKIIAALQESGVQARFDIVGDGPERRDLEEICTHLNIEGSVHFHGWKSRSEINPFYEKAHFILFPSRSEGWPKVLSEAMAFGVVPLASSVSSIPQYLHKFGSGHSFPPDDLDAFANAVLEYRKQPDKWKQESENSIIAAKHFSYNAYLNAVRKLLEIH